MANKKVQAQMQIDVSFIGNTTKLFKDLEQSFSKLNLSSNLTKQLEADLNKSFKDTFANLGKMSEGLSKTGLSSKQYTNFFNTINTKVSESTKIFSTLKKNLTDIYNSTENQKAIKDLEEYKKQLQEINKIASQQKASQTRQNTAITKMKDETGIDYNISKRMITNIASRKANNQELTKNQQDWVTANGLDENKLKRILELLRQINAQRKSISEGDDKAQNITGQAGGVNGSTAYLEKQINKAGQDSLSSSDYKNNIAILEKTKQAMSDASKASDTLEESFGKKLPQAEKEAEDMAQGMQTLNEVLSQFGIVLSAGTIVRAFKDIIESAFEFYKSLDSALNEIYVVSNLSIDAVNNLKTDFIGMAKETGMALDDVTRSAVLFYQQGLNTDEVLEMTRVTSEFAKVAGIDATDAADKLTAAVNGYCLAAEDASTVADKFNKVAAASAADINELSTAFSKAAAQANQAGVSMDNYLAYIATMEEATREAPENIGTSLKTIFSRMQQVKESGTSEDGETDVNDVETALKSVGIQLRDTEGELRDLEDVFDELGPKWNSLDRNTQAYLGTIIAGTRQQSRFITLMQNWDRVLELSEESANSAGQQALMHAKAMDSIESKLQQLQVAWQEFISKLANSDLFKGIIDTLTKFVNKLNDGNTPMVLLGTSVALLSKQLTKLDGPFNKFVQKAGKSISSVKKLTPANLKMAASYVKNKNELNKYSKVVDTSKKNISDLTKENNKAQKEMSKMEKATGLTKDELAKTNPEYQQLNEKVTKNKDLIKQNTDAMTQASGEIKNINKNLEEEKNAYDGAIEGMQTAIVATTALSAILPGVLGNLAGAASGFLMMGQGATKAAGLVTTSLIPAFTAAKAAGVSTCEAIATAIASTGIGAIIEAIALAAMGAITAIKSLVEAFGDQTENIKESVDTVAGALESYTNAANEVKGVESLLKTYEKLSNKIYLTTSEQEKLNDTVQSLADSLDLEVVEDEYGNLSVSIADVTEKIDEMKAEAEEAREELAKTEQEEIEKYDHNGNVSNFYDQYLKSHKSDIRNAMSDIDTNIDTDDLATSSANVETIMNNLKNTIIQDSSEMSEAFGGLGVKWSLTEDVESMVQSFNSANIDSSKWNNLYQTFDLLQDKIDNISYDKALETVESAIKVWGESAGLTATQVDEMKNAIMDSLYSDSNLNKTINKYQDILDQSSGKSYEDQLSSYEQQLSDLEEESTTFWNPFKQDDAEREYESLQKKKQLLEDEQQKYEEFKRIQDEINEGQEYGYDLEGNSVNLEEYRNELMEEYGFSTDSEVEKAQTMRDILGQFSDSSAEFFDKVGMFDEDASGLLEKLQDNGSLSTILGAYTEDTDEGTRALTDALVDIINNTDDAELKSAAEDKLSAVFKNIQVSGQMSWTDLSDTLDTVSEDLRNMNDLLTDFRENGGFTLDTFADLCDMLDSIDLSAIFDAGKMDQFIGALENLQLGFDASTGVITANGEALQSLGDIQEAITKAKLAETAQSLEADKASLQSQIYGIEAEIAANNALIEYLRTASDADLEIDKVKEQGQIDYNNTMQQAATNAGKLYSNMTTNSSAWAEASIKNAAAVGEAVKAAMSGDLGTANLDAYLSNIVSEMKYEDTGSYGIIQMNTKDGKVNRDAAIKALQDYNAKGQNTIDKLYSEMKGIEQMQGLLNTLSNSDLSKLGSDGSGSDNDIDKYIGKLKEIYNITNRISILEHRLSTLDSYADVAQGEKYGELLKERLQYNNELVDQYEFLTSEQKQFTNGYKDFIQSVDGLEGVFDFDQYGQIIINWEKYVALEDEAADGETTLKEKADDLYDTYTEMFEELQDDFDNTIKYYQAVIDLEQEMVDSYIDMQNQAADAVKEIYQKILDTKLDAIDQEKEAIEDLREAREQANKDTENAKAISGLQTNIQRAMMDTSGASDVSFIKAEQDLDDKLNDIAEDKYSDMLDNIIDQLNEQADLLQDEFDEMFDQLDWLFTFLDDDIMGDESALYSLLQQTDEWNQSSFLERQQKLDAWETSFNTYYKSMVENDKGIYGIYDNITETKERINTLDTNLQSSISKGSAEIAQTIAGWQSSQSSSGSGSSSGGSSGGSSSSSYSGKTYTTTTNYTPTVTGLDSTLTNTTKTTTVDTGKFTVGQKIKSAEQERDGGINQVRSYWKEGTNSFKTNIFYWEFGSSMKGQTIKEAKKGSDGKWYYRIPMAYTNEWFREDGLVKYKKGGLANFTGPAWLDGTESQPEAVLNALQTEHFIQFTDALDKIASGSTTTTSNGTVNIDNIQFQVESMSSEEDGEKAFTAFVNKFKEIGNQTGIKIDTFKNTL